MAKIKIVFSNIKKFALSHKIISVIILIIFIASPFIISNFIPKKVAVRYMTQAVKRGNIDVSISGTGQISSSKNVSLASEVSGEVTRIYVSEGEEVARGDLLFKIDSTDGVQNVKSAELALESAELDLEKMLEPVDELTLLQAENALVDAQESKTKTETNLKKDYDDGFTDVSNAFLDLPSIMTGLNNVLFLKNINGSQQNIDFYATAINYYDDKGTQYRDDAYNKYVAAKTKYDKNLVDYKATSRYSDEKTIESLILETYDTTKAIAEAIKSANNLVEFYKYTLSDRLQSYNATADSHISSLSGYSAKTNSHISSLFSASNTIQDDKDSIVSAERLIAIKKLSLEDTKEGATDLEIKTQKLTITQKEQALSEARDKLSKYTITAPFSGIISSVDADKGDTVNSGTAMGSIIANDMIATITLNEVDIAKVKVGQKAELAFDALDDVSINGEVAKIDVVGTVSQGVVSYSVDISFETDDERIKPGMSISANIIIESSENVLTIPSGAIKTMGDKNFVEVMSVSGAIERREVEIGITDDTLIEIKSGLSEGDKVVTNVAGTTKKSNTTSGDKKSNSTFNSLNSGDRQPPMGGMGGSGM